MFYKKFIIICLIKQLIIILCVSGRQTDSNKNKLFTDEQLKNLAESVCSEMKYFRYYNMDNQTCEDSFSAPDTSMAPQPSGAKIQCQTTESIWFQVDSSKWWQLIVLVPKVTNDSQTDIRLNYVIVHPLDKFEKISTMPLRMYTIWSTILEEGIPVEWRRGEEVPEFNQPEHRTYEIKKSLFCHFGQFNAYGKFSWNISRDSDVCFVVLNSCNPIFNSSKLWLNMEDEEPQMVFDYLSPDLDCIIKVTGLYGTTQLHYHTPFCDHIPCMSNFHPETPDGGSAYMRRESVDTWVVDVEWAPPDCTPDFYNVTLIIGSRYYLGHYLVKAVSVPGIATGAAFNNVKREMAGEYYVVIQAILGEQTAEINKTVVISEDQTIQPERPANISIKANEVSANTWDVKVNWSQPHRIPDSYIVILNNLTSFTKQVLPGTQTKAKFKNITVKNETAVFVSIRAMLGTRTEEVSERVYFPGIEEELGGRKGAIVAGVAGIGVTCVGAATLALIFYCRRLRHRAPVPPCKPSRCCEPEDRWDVRADKLELHEVIGEGAFGIVYRATLAPQSVQVAVKTLKCLATLDEIRAFHSEMELMKNVGVHPHLVSLVGCCSGSKPLIIVEYCSRGDLLSYLRSTWDVMLPSKRNMKHCSGLFKCKAQMGSSKIVSKLYEHQEICDKELTALDLLSFCRQIAIGMEFLAANRVVHRDLAARNILVTADRNLKISDFGLSRDVYEENQYTQKSYGKMPIKWLALESLMKGIYTTRSDVWSFGVVMYEIVTMGEAPYTAVPFQRLPRLLCDGYRMPKPNNCSPQLYDIMLSCWRTNPRERPDFVELHQHFDELLSSACDNQYLSLNIDTVDSRPPLTLETDEYDASATLAQEIDPDDASATLAQEIDADDESATLAQKIDADDASPTLALEIDADGTPPTLALEIDTDNVPPPLELEIDTDDVPPTLALEIDKNDVPPTLALEIDADGTPPTLALEIDTDDMQPTQALEIHTDDVPPTLTLEIDKNDVPPTPALEIDTDGTLPTLALEIDTDGTPPTLALEITRL